MPKRGPVIIFHGRRGRPVVHVTETGREFMMVRKPGGGVKRLYEGSLYYEEPTRKRRRKRRRRLIL